MNEPRRFEEETSRYEFVLAQDLSEAALASFPELTAVGRAAGGVSLYGKVIDRSHLYGILARFQNLGIDVLEMRQLPD
jgi:hypothetical protein